MTVCLKLLSMVVTVAAAISLLFKLLIYIVFMLLLVQ